MIAKAMGGVPLPKQDGGSDFLVRRSKSLCEDY
jgi:hypothetical protein